MGYQDRDYSRSQPGGNVLRWLLTGSVPLFRIFGIPVRMYAGMLIFIALNLLLGASQGMSAIDRFESMTMLFVVVLLHELGHCLGARAVGGDALQILMHPLGGLASTDTKCRPFDRFITVAAGPAVNLLLLVFSGAVLLAFGAKLATNPFAFEIRLHSWRWLALQSWVAWFYQINFMLLAFNLLPIFPLDGGQLFQCALWPKLGFRRSLLIASRVGLAGAVLLAGYSLATWNMWPFVIALWGFTTCLQQLRMFRAGLFEEYGDGADFASGYATTDWQRQDKKAKRAGEKLRQAQQRERQTIDRILAKVSAHGMQSLNWQERRALRRATESQRARDAKLKVAHRS